MRLSGYEVEKTQEKLAKINARAEKKGFTGRVDMTVQRVEVGDWNEIGLWVVEIWYDCEITGEAPSYNGSRLIATVDWLSDQDMIVNVAPGIKDAMVNRANLKDGWCDHCKTTRDRRKYYVVEREDGSQLQVGSTCLKDFLGWQGHFSFVDVKSVTDELDGFLGGGGYRELSWSPVSVLAAAYAAIKVNGYIRSDAYDAVPTKITTFDILCPPKAPKIREEIKRTYSPLVDESLEVAKEVLTFLLSDDFSGDSEYVLNLKTLARQEAVTSKHIGYLASAPQAYARFQEKTLIRERDKAELQNAWVGNVGDRIETEAKVKSVRWTESAYGSTTIYTLVNRVGYVFKWFASRDALGDKATDEYFAIKGTIKKHDEYQGLKSTVLTRCSLVKK